MEIVLLVLRFLLAAALYAFLGWAFWLLWQELRQAARQTEVAGVIKDLAQSVARK